MERPDSSLSSNVQWGLYSREVTRTWIKKQFHWTKEFNKEQSTGGLLLEASNVISDTCCLENKGLLFRGADLVLSAPFDNLETPISPFRAKCLHQEETNHVVKVPISLH